MRRIAVLYAFFAVSAASYENPSDPSPDAVQAFNPSNAPDPACRTNEEYIQCATHCEATCYNPNPVCIRSCAPAQCQCVYGYVRNDYGECVSGNSCPETTTEQPEETTTEYVYSTEAPVEETTTLSPVTDEPAPQYYNTPTSTAAYEEPTTTTEEPTTQQYEPAPTYAPAPVEPYAPEETPAPQTDSDYVPQPTAAPSSDYSSSGQNSGASSSHDAAPAIEDEDTVVVGGTCGENTCRVGFKCDDSTSVGAKCITYDTRARSSCSAIRCRPGWGCVIAMDGPRCYRNSVLGIADAPPTTTEASPAPEFTGPPPPGYSADEPASPADGPVPPVPELPADWQPEPKGAGGEGCAELICPFGHTCFGSTTSTPSDAFCRSVDAGRDSPAQLCADVQCKLDESCTDEHNGPACNKNAPATCAATSCLTGSACVEHPEGARCEAPSPLVFPGKTCADSECPSLHQCFDTVDGASCYPIPTDPIDNVSEPLKCAQIACTEGEECHDDEVGGVCKPKEYATDAPSTNAIADEPAPVADEPLARAGSPSSDADCEHTTCGAGETCAVNFEGASYCRAAEGDAPASVSSVSSDPTTHLPACSEITCPTEHECFDDSVKGAACWPLNKSSCKNHSCQQSEICVEESSGPRCVPTQRRGVVAPGYRRRI